MNFSRYYSGAFDPNIIYMSLFTLLCGKKSKKDLDHSFYDAFEEDNFSITKVVDAAKMLRKNKVDVFRIKSNFEYEELSFIYSVIDNYNSNKNWLNKKYSKEGGYNLEHFIVPYNKRGNISWDISGTVYNWVLTVDTIKKFKKNTLNFLIMDKALNESIENKDIVSKIVAIKEWYNTPGRVLPKHMELIINYIESLEEYQNLKDLKDAQVEERVLESYERFINAYFMDESQQKLYDILQKEFIKAFSNE